MKLNKKCPSKISYTLTRKKRNMFVFDAGLHTLKMKMNAGEKDNEFVERFLVAYFNGCRKRGGNKYKDYLMWHDRGEDYIFVWGVKK